MVRLSIKTSSNHLRKYHKISGRFLIFLFIIYQILISHFRSKFLVSAFHVLPTASLLLSKRDVTKVFHVVKNDGSQHDNNNCASIRSDIGLLTSTAGTFIQKGVTTKYATQFVGTAIENGRIYAQYLKESSHVSFNQNHNEPTLDTSWIGNKFQSNICSNKNELSKDVKINKHIEQRQSDLGIQQNLANQSNITPKNLVELKEITLNDIYKVNVRNTREKKKYATSEDEHHNNIGYDLPLKYNLSTYTINNNYEASKLSRDTIQINEFTIRNPKYIHRDIRYSSAPTQSSPQLVTEKMLNLTSVTYFGFADFTTMVGESIIVFLPGLDPNNRNRPIHTTSISGEATLNEFNSKIYPSVNVEPFKGIEQRPFATASEWQYKEVITTNQLFPTILRTITGVNKLFATYPFQLLQTENITSMKSLIKPATTATSNYTQALINQKKKIVGSKELGESLCVLLTVNNRNNKNYINTETYNQSNQSNIEAIEGATTIFFEDNEDQLFNFGYNDKFQEVDLNPNTICSQTENVSNVPVKNNIEQKYVCNQFKSFSMQTSNTNMLKSLENYLLYSERDMSQNFKIERESEMPQFIPNFKLENNLCENRNTQNFCRNEGDEVELTFKTLYTTHTYLITYFDNNNTNFFSHTDIISNITTITINNESYINYIPSILQYREDEGNEIQTTLKKPILPSKAYLLPTELELGKWKKTLIKPQVTTNFQEAFGNQLYKTYYTIYTYYTTLHFGSNETETMLHTEIYTNILKSSKTNDYSEVSDTGNSINNNNSNIINVTISLASITSPTDNKIIKNAAIDQHFSNSHNWQLWSNKSYSLFMEDLISLESNVDDEIIPSAALLLKTSFTTFTYFTTMYIGDKSSIISHLETITSTVTETLNLLNSRNSDEKILPITYFTTYTYWTKLAKDHQITTWSSEKIISNVISPTNVINAFNVPQTIHLNNPLVKFTIITQYSNINDKKNDKLQVMEDVYTKTDKSIYISQNSSTFTKNSEIDKFLEETTFYTTYTYCITSYEAKETVVNSSFKVKTNIIRNIFFITPTTLSNDLLPLLTVPHQDSNNLTQTYLPTYDLRKIIDADGISTLYFTTEVISNLGSDGVITLLTTSTSNLYIDINKQIQLSKTISSSIESFSDGQNQKSHKTGLVRIIEGTRISNNTTTYYQSKVIGTFIDKRYAQIIDSTSSLIFAKTNSMRNYSSLSMLSLNVDSRNILLNTILSTGIVYEINTNSSIHCLSELSRNSDSLFTHSIPIHNLLVTKIGNVSNSAEIIDTPLEISTRSFIPSIRPFAVRRRLPFIPKKNNLLPSSATIITRSGVTPTITATPALKSINRLSSVQRLGVQSNGGFSVRSSRFNKLVTLTSNSNLFSTLSNRFNSVSTSTFRVNDPTSSPEPNSRFFSKVPLSRVGIFSGGFPRTTNGKFTSTNTVLELITQKKLKLGDKDTSTFTAANTKKENSNATFSKKNNPSLRLQRSQLRRNSFITSLLINPSSLYKKSSSSAPYRSILKIERNLISSARIEPAQRSLDKHFPTGEVFNLQKLQTEIAILAHAYMKQPRNHYSNGYSEDYVEDLEKQIDAETNIRKRSNSNNILTNTSQMILINLKKDKIRKKRQIEGILKIRSNFRNRFRAPKISANTQTIPETKNARMTNATNSTLRSGANYGTHFSNRKKPRNFSPLITNTIMSTVNSKLIRPSRLHLNSRSQFTLREKDPNELTLHKGHTVRPSFRRSPLESRANLAHSTSISSETAEYSNRRLKNDNTHNLLSMRSRNAQTRNKYQSLRGRSKHRDNSNGHMRSRPLNLKAKTPVLYKNNGTITITQMIQATVSVPIINGNITEYKRITTAKISTNIIEPDDYTTYIDNNGQSNLILNKEDTIINSKGTTEIIQYVLHASPTTTVIFTPTTIRGRKTSFSHVLPSTAYTVEQVTSTKQSQITANAPLANILLSQLLLGNVRAPENALFNAFSQPSLPNIAFSQKQFIVPVTEYKTRKSTYITTLYKGESTVLPVTFQGKKILTTIYDTNAETVTATECITDTIINTPSPIATEQVQPLLNSFLLQQLQQQLLLQQPLIENPTEPNRKANFKLLADSISSQLYFSNNNILQESEVARNIHEIYGNSGGILMQPSVDIIDMDLELKTQNLKPKSIQTSIVTLYVSGRRPGQFSTVLSTIEI